MGKTARAGRQKRWLLDQEIKYPKARKLLPWISFGKKMLKK